MNKKIWNFNSDPKHFYAYTKLIGEDDSKLFKNK